MRTPDELIAALAGHDLSLDDNDCATLTAALRLLKGRFMLYTGKGPDGSADSYLASFPDYSAAVNAGARALETDCYTARVVDAATGRTEWSEVDHDIEALVIPTENRRFENAN